jgi:hypothetical protein
MFGDIRPLANEPDSHLAFDLLFRAAEAVQGVMTRRNWTVGVLREFLPRSSKLLGLNVNGGQVICVRLRKERKEASRPRERAARAHGEKGSFRSLATSSRVRCLADIPGTSASNFFAFEDVLGTLLHELVHIEIRNHNQAFYALLDTLWLEVRRIAGSTSSCGSAGALSLVPANGHRLGQRRAPTPLPSAAQHIAHEQELRRQLLATAAMRRLEKRRVESAGELSSKQSQQQSEPQAIASAQTEQLHEHDIHVIEDDRYLLSTGRHSLNNPVNELRERQCCRVIQVIDLTVSNGVHSFDLIDLSTSTDDDDDDDDDDDRNVS